MQLWQQRLSLFKSVEMCKLKLERTCMFEMQIAILSEI